jgi:hypothetical protein
MSPDFKFFLIGYDLQMSETSLTMLFATQTEPLQCNFVNQEKAL